MHNYTNPENDFITFLKERVEKKMQSRLNSMGERYTRRVEAMTLVENNLSLLELIADIYDYYVDMEEKALIGICEYVRRKHGIEIPFDDFFVPFEALKGKCVNWMSEIFFEMRDFHENCDRFKRCSDEESLKRKREVHIALPQEYIEDYAAELFTE